MTSPLRFGITPQASWGSDLPNPRPTRLPQDNQRLGSSTFLRHPIASRLDVGRFVHPKVNSHLATKNWLGRACSGTGISTGCASTTPFGLALAPD